MIRLSTITLFFFTCAGIAFAQEKKLTYQDQVLPFLREKCAACHNPDKKQGGLSVVTYSALMEGGGRGKSVEPGDPENSPLYLVMAHKEQPFMPPKADKLPEKDLQLIANWIKSGALENSGSTASVQKPKADLGLKTVKRGKPEGPPPMPTETLALEVPQITPRGTAVIAMDASPWAPLLAVAGQKGVLLYHTDSLDLIGVLPFPYSQINVLKFSRNGSLLIAGGGRSGQLGKVVVYDVKTGNRVTEVGEELDAVLAADISPDQTQIALGGSSKMVRIFSTSDGKQLHQLKKHTDWVTSIEYSPDGVLLGSGDRSGGITVWETASGQEYQTLRGPQQMITELSWRLDGNLLACISEDSQVRFYEMENGNQIKAFGAHGGGGSAIRFHQDGRIVTVGRDRVPKVWKADGTAPINFPALPDVGLRGVFAADGKKIFVSDWTGNISAFTMDAKPAGVLTSAPPALETRLTLAQKKVEDTAARHTLVAAGAKAATDAMNKANGEMAAIQKQVADLTASQKAHQEATAKIVADGGYMAHQAATADVAAKERATGKLAEAVARAKEASEQLKQNAELAAFATQSQALLQKHQTELAAAKTYTQQLAATVKPLQDKLAGHQAELAKLAPALQAATAQVAPKVAQVKTLQTNQAAANAQVQVVQQELDLAKNSLTRLQKAIESRKPVANKTAAK